ncbi:MAG: 3-isopropylmalate dehydratase small subunit [Alphaproteobacteria bacterium]
MTPFTKLTAAAAPLPMVNVDTDMIIPKQFLKTIERTGLGKYLFNDMRRAPDGSERPDFVLNRAPYRDAKILIAGANFGCGSSREHAPWALLDYGISCVIAPSFADIFHGNCFKNGILPIVLPQEEIDDLIRQISGVETRQANGAPLSIDLETQTITAPDGRTISFGVDSFRRDCLLKGLDEIGLTLQHEAEITAFEAKQREQQPWLWQKAGS